MMTAYSSSQEFVDLALGPATGVRQFIPSPSNSCPHQWGSRDEALVSANENRCSSVIQGMRWDKATRRTQRQIYFRIQSPESHSKGAWKGSSSVWDRVNSSFDETLLLSRTPITGHQRHKATTAWHRTEGPYNNNDYCSYWQGSAPHHGPCGTARSFLFGFRQSQPGLAPDPLWGPGNTLVPAVRAKFGCLEF